MWSDRAAASKVEPSAIDDILRIHASRCFAGGRANDEKLTYRNEVRLIDQVLRNERPGGACAGEADYEGIIERKLRTARADCRRVTGVDKPWPTDRPREQ
jgi:hypothetical protein